MAHALAVLVMGTGCGSGGSVVSVEPSVTPPPVVIDDQWVVHVSGEACGSRSSGGGVVVAPGLVITNAHVMAGVTDVALEGVGLDRPLEGSVVGFDARRDLAAVRIADVDLTPVTIHEGDPPASLRLVTWGEDGQISERPAEVSRLIVATGDDIYREPGARRSAIELGIAVAEGESGSGLFSDRGELVGVLFANSSSRDGRSYAVAASEIIDFLAETAGAAEPAGPCLTRPPPTPDVD